MFTFSSAWQHAKPRHHPRFSCNLSCVRLEALPRVHAHPPAPSWSSFSEVCLCHLPAYPEPHPLSEVRRGSMVVARHMYSSSMKPITRKSATPLRKWSNLSSTSVRPGSFFPSQYSLFTAPSVPLFPFSSFINPFSSRIHVVYSCGVKLSTSCSFFFDWLVLISGDILIYCPDYLRSVVARTTTTLTRHHKGFRTRKLVIHISNTMTIIIIYSIQWVGAWPQT